MAPPTDIKRSEDFRRKLGLSEARPHRYPNRTFACCHEAAGTSDATPARPDHNGTSEVQLWLDQSLPAAPVARARSQLPKHIEERIASERHRLNKAVAILIGAELTAEYFPEQELVTDPTSVARDVVAEAIAESHLCARSFG